MFSLLVGISPWLGGTMFVSQGIVVIFLPYPWSFLLLRISLVLLFSVLSLPDFFVLGLQCLGTNNTYHQYFDSSTKYTMFSYIDTLLCMKFCVVALCLYMKYAKPTF